LAFFPEYKFLIPLSLCPYTAKEKQRLDNLGQELNFKKLLIIGKVTKHKPPSKI
jgi:hypothetical protein